MGSLWLGLIALSSIESWSSTASLRLQNSQYFSSSTNFYREDAAASNSSISLQLEQDKRFGKRFALKSNVKDEYSATENWNYLNVREAYGQYRPPINLTAQVGRKIETWSATDDEWKQGIFQSRYMQNKLRPETAGLTGVFLSSSVGANLFTVAMMPVFVPDLGTHFWVSNDKLTSRNPWFDPPAERFRLNGMSHDIHYSLDKPSAGEVLAHPGVAAKVERSTGMIGARFSAAYKPVPQLLLGFPVANRFVLNSDGNYLNVEITPKVAYHSVASADIWGRAGGWTLTGGLTYDRPVNDAVDEDWIWQNYKPAWIWSGMAMRPLFSNGETKVKLGFLKVDGGAGQDRGIYASRETVFEGRFQYDEAYLAALSWPIRGIFKNAFETEAKVVYDRIQNGGVVSIGAGYSFSRDWRVDGEMDLLGLTGERAEKADGFFSTYRSNDRFGLGMSYVF